MWWNVIQVEAWCCNTSAWLLMCRLWLLTTQAECFGFILLPWKCVISLYLWQWRKCETMKCIKKHIRPVGLNQAYTNDAPTKNIYIWVFTFNCYNPKWQKILKVYTLNELIIIPCGIMKIMEVDTQKKMGLENKKESEDSWENIVPPRVLIGRCLR